MNDTTPTAVNPAKLVIEDVYKTTWDIVRAHFGSAIGISAVTFFGALGVAGSIGGLGYLASDFEHQRIAPFIVCMFVAYLVFIGGIIAGSGAVNAIFLDALRGRPTSFADSLARGVARTPILIANLFVLAIVIGIGLVLCCVPGIMAFFAFSLVAPVIIEEDVGPIEALQRSYALTDGHKLEVFLIFLVWYAVQFGAQVISMVLGGAIGAALGPIPIPGFPAELSSILYSYVFLIPISLLLVPAYTALFCVVYDRRSTIPKTQGADVAAVFR